MTEIVWTSSFSVLSSILCAGLALLSLRQRGRKGGLIFFVLCFSMGAWQFGKFAKNTGLIPWGDWRFWDAYSFWGASVVYPSFFGLCWMLFAKKKKVWKPLGLLAWATAAFFVFSYHYGWLLGNFQQTQWGVRHEVYPLYWAYMTCYSAYMVTGIVLIFVSGNAYGPDLRLPARLMFYASCFGFAVGALEFLDIFWKPLFPWQDLAPAIFAIVFYWAIYRFDFLEGGKSLRYLLESFLKYVVFIVFLAILMPAQEKIEAVFFFPYSFPLVGALLLLLCLPLYEDVLGKIKKKWSPIIYHKQETILELSTLLSSGDNPEKMAKSFRNLLRERLSFYKSSGILLLENQSPILFGKATLDDLLLLQQSPKKLLFRRELLHELRMQQPNKNMNAVQFGEWKLLSRLKADLFLPVCWDEKVTLLFWMKDSVSKQESWSGVKPTVQAMASLLKNALSQWMLQHEMAREKEMGQMGLMASELAHEIKNPLEGIYGAAQLLEEEQKGNARFVNMILKDSQRLHGTVQDFLFLARPYSAPKENLSLNNWLEEHLKHWEQSGLSIQVSVEVEQKTMYWNSRCLEQILLNLLQNAKRYQIEGKDILLRVLSLPSKGLCFRIEDEGRGVSIEDRHKLFRPFFTTEAKGTGLGLVFSRKMARGLGGDLYFEPLKQGSAFCVTLGKEEHNEP